MPCGTDAGTGWNRGAMRGLRRGANRTARELESRNIGKGDCVLLWGENSPEWMVLFFGCVLRGAVVVPIDHGSTPDFVARVSREVNAKLLVRSRASVQPELEPDSIELESLAELCAKHDSSPYPALELTRQDTLEIIFTSGTTAEPRGVVISHGNVLANIEPLEKEITKYLKYERIFHPIRFLNLLPLSHVFGQMLGIFIPPLLAGTVVYVNSQKPGELIEVVRRERVSVLVAVPRIIESLRREILRQMERDAHLKEFEETFASSERQHFLLRWWRFRKIHSRLGWKFWAIISGGAALPEVEETFWNRLGYAVIQGYGMTETTSMISLNHPFQTAKGSIGKLFLGWKCVGRARRNSGPWGECRQGVPATGSDQADGRERWMVSHRRPGRNGRAGEAVFQRAKEKCNCDGGGDERIPRGSGKSTEAGSRREGLRGDWVKPRRQRGSVRGAAAGKFFGERGFSD